MESSEEARASNHKECVKVAVNVRPLITSELLIGCTDCVTVVPGEPQVQIGAHAFTYDNVYGNSGSPSSLIFEECVAPLVDALFLGYNATVLAYGQTGSGKTYTMGTNYNGDDNGGGIIPQVMDTIFRKIDTQREKTEFLIRVSFIEIFKEEVFDLLDPHTNTSLRAEGAPSHAKLSIPSRTPIQIRETTNGGIILGGVVEAEVRSKEEMASYLTRGSLARATGSTNMNSQSSRSHAIFTIFLEQKKTANSLCPGATNDELGKDILFSKLHLVDLAGSECAKRTGADGLRFKEGVHINKGLLSLGNVISALGDGKKRKEGRHVPYRDSKLTRLLQDSLGGNSKTVVIACISPADINAKETINTLKYANRAQNIHNKAVINRDPMASEMQRMRNQLEQLQAELLLSRGGGASFEELQVLRGKVSLLKANNVELHKELKECQITCDHFAQCAIDAQVEKDKLSLKIESAISRKAWDEIDNTDNKQECDLLKNYVSKIQELETELLRVQTSATPKGETEEDEREREHTSLQDILDKELQELDKRLEQKEVSKSKKKQEAQTQLLRQKQKSDDEAKRLQKEIERIKCQKVQLQHKIKQESMKFRSWKASREKEFLQHIKERRRNEYELRQLLDLHQRHNTVLQRKMNEATLAVERLKELLEAKASSRQMSGSRSHQRK